MIKNGISRRNFIKNSSIALAAPLIFPSGLFGSGSPSNTINVGIVGCGNRSMAHIGSFMGIPGVRVVAVCDIWSSRASDRKSRVDKGYGDTHCKMYNDYRDLVADSEVDVVAVGVPDHWHSLVAIEAANKGKHIYLEKPFAYSIEEGRAIINAVKRNGVILQHGTQQRSNFNFQRASWLARNGRIGNVDRVYAISPPGPQGGDSTISTPPEGYDFDFFTGPAPKIPFFNELGIRPGTPGWYFTSIFGGGWVTAWGSHHVDSAVSALGKDYEAPVKVEVEGKYPEKGAWDTAYEWYAEFTYADGKKLIYLTSNRKEAPGIAGNIVAVGDKGWVSAGRNRFMSNPAHLSETVWPRGDQEFPLLEKGGDMDHFANLINSIRYGEKLSAPMEVGHLTTTLCHLTNIGIEVQRPLEWDGDAERFKNDTQANRMLGRPMRAPWKL